MPLFDLRAGYDSLHRELEGVPSRYAAAPAAEASRDDGIPDFLDGRRANGSADDAAEASYVDLVGGGR